MSLPKYWVLLTPKYGQKRRVMQKFKNFPKQCAALRILLPSQLHFLALLPCWELYNIMKT